MFHTLLTAIVLCGLATAQDAEVPTPPDSNPDANTASRVAKGKEYDPAAVKFIIGGIVPKDQTYTPLTGQQRWQLFVNENFSVKSGAYFRAFGSALPDHLNNRPQDWGQGTKGYMTRVGDRFARFTMSSAIQNVGQYALGHDPRYVRCKCDGFWPRFGHATVLSFMTYDRNGKKVFNVMNFAGAFGSEYIAGQWTPGTNPTVAGYQGAVQQIGAGWIFNVLREFGPEMKRAFTRKK